MLASGIQMYPAYRSSLDFHRSRDFRSGALAWGREVRGPPTLDPSTLLHGSSELQRAESCLGVDADYSRAGGVEF